MRCEAARKDISRFVDGELTSEEQILLEEHLVHCEACRQLLREEQELWNSLGELEWPEPSSHGLWLRIDAALAEQALQETPWKRFQAFLVPRWHFSERIFPIAGMVLGVLFGIFLSIALGVFQPSSAGNSAPANYKVTLAQEAFEGHSPLLDVALSMSYSPEKHGH